MKKGSILPFSSEEVSKCNYDVVLASTGYERRARHSVQKLIPNGDRKFAPAFADRQVLDFQQNRSFFEDAGFETCVIADDEFNTWCVDVVKSKNQQMKHPSEMRILIDISSMSRFRMAAIIDAVRFSRSECSIRIDFVYAVANFSKPPKGCSPITEFKPVTNRFAGWTTDPSCPTCAIAGLGYEQDHVIGVVDNLEPAEIWAFVPIGPDERYQRSVETANEALWDDLPEDHRIPYSIHEPLYTFIQLESLVYGILCEAKPIIIPFGPKIFSVVSMLVAAVHDPHVAVWRVSCGQAEEPRNRIASGQIIGLSAVFQHVNESEICHAENSNSSELSTMNCNSGSKVV